MSNLKYFKMKKFVLSIVLFCIMGLFIWSCNDDEEPAPASNNQPSVPANPDPADGELNVLTSPVLSWTCSDPDAGDVLKYDIYFGAINPPNTLLVSNWNDPNYAITGLENYTNYYWRVTAHDSNGGTSVGPIWHFTTASDIPTEGLIAYYPFNGNANDETGLSEDGIPDDVSPTTDRFNIANKAYSFNGTGSKITFNTNFIFHETTDVSFSIWLLNDASSTRTSILISTLANWNDVDRFHFYYTEEISQNFISVDYRCPTCSTGPANQLVHYAPWNKNVWTHFVLIRENNLYTAYLDGQLIGTQQDLVLDLPTSVGWALGMSIGVMDPYSGKMDDIRIYNRALSETEIQALYLEGGW
jgi:hypothetical protein